MANTQTLDMTRGKPLPILVRFALPLILGSLFQQLYSFVDTAIVGRCISADALTAVGVTGSLNFLVLGFTMGSAMGFCIPISQAVGAGDREEVSRNFWNGLYLSVAIGLLISIGVSLFTRPLLVMMNTPAQLLDMATEYLTIILLGQITTVLYNYFSGVLRAFGDSKRPFWFLVISSCINVVLDLVLILVIPMGVAGAAVATVTSQAVSAALCIWWLVKKMDVIQRKNEQGQSLMRLSGKHMGKICVIGMPLGLEYSVCSIGNVILQSSINTLGTVAAAAQICGEKIRQIATLPMESMGMAMATYAGQNYGARRMDRIKSGIRAGLIIQTTYSAAAWAVLLVLKKPLVYLLLGEVSSPEAAASIEYLTIITTLFVFHGSLMIFRNTVQGMGFGASALASAVMEIIGRSSAGLLAVRCNSFFLICVSSPMAWVLACICCVGLCAYYIPKKPENSPLNRWEELMKLLLTAFDPFGGSNVNPAQEAVRLVADRVGDVEIVKLEVPTVFGKSVETVAAAIERERPDAVLCVGQAGGRYGLNPERVAINLDDASIPDNEGSQPIDAPIFKDGAPAYFSTLPIKAMVARIREAGLPASVSNTAGTFVCNHLMYGLLYTLERNWPGVRGGFLHVPYLPGQTVNHPAPSMSRGDIARGIEAAITAIAEHRTDISSAK